MKAREMLLAWRRRGRGRGRAGGWLDPLLMLGGDLSKLACFYLSTTDGDLQWNTSAIDSCVGLDLSQLRIELISDDTKASGCLQGWWWMAPLRVTLRFTDTCTWDVGDTKMPSLYDVIIQLTISLLRFNHSFQFLGNHPVQYTVSVLAKCVDMLLPSLDTLPLRSSTFKEM